MRTSFAPRLTFFFGAGPSLAVGALRFLPGMGSGEFAGTLLFDGPEGCWDSRLFSTSATPIAVECVEFEEAIWFEEVGWSMAG